MEMAFALIYYHVWHNDTVGLLGMMMDHKSETNNNDAIV